MYEETNQLLPEQGRIPPDRIKLLAFTILREHRRLLPYSSKRRAVYVFTIAGLTLFISFVAIAILSNG